MDNLNYMWAVRQFMSKHGQPMSYRPCLQPESLMKFRLDLIEEEFNELKTAVESKNLYLIADALADLKYVIFGMDITLGIPAESIFDEVHRSNMTKDVVRDRGDAVKVQKGSSYSRPRIKEIIDSAIRVSL